MPIAPSFPRRVAKTVAILLFVMLLGFTARLTAFADGPAPIPAIPPQLPSVPPAAPPAPAPASPAPVTPAAPAAIVPSGVMQAQLLVRLNAIRAEHNLPPLTYNLKLEAAAQGHVLDMQGRGSASHRGSNGSTYGQRISAAGYSASSVNETIGWGNNLDRQITWWMNSSLHRSIILSPTYTEIGIGYAGDPTRTWGHWWTVNYAVPTP